MNKKEDIAIKALEYNLTVVVLHKKKLEDQKHFEEKFVTPLYDQIGVSTTKPANYQLKIDELVIKEQAIREAVIILKDYYLSQGTKTVSNEK